MRNIQIDMFEVQLGAALLLQFRDSDGKPVVILADAGVQSSGYPVEHVRDKLPAAMDAFENGNRRIDLIVGTHYDADHLRGLVPIIDDLQFTIGEAWMPPVADDVSPIPLDSQLSDDQLLALKWSRENGSVTMAQYFKSKLEQCSKLKELEGQAAEIKSLGGSMFHREFPHATIPGATAAGEDFPWRDIFERHLEDTAGLPGDDHHACHADDPCFEPEQSEAERVNNLADRGSFNAGFRTLFLGGALIYPATTLNLQDLWSAKPELAHPQGLTLAATRRTIANDAITGTYLADTVKALKKRKIPIRCQIIPDGTPMRFVWRSADQKFVQGARLASDGPELRLLGPSQSLVKKHRDRLPFETYLFAIARTAIPIRGITPSNQLSYIFRIEADNQGILVTGDAGCVDFKPTARDPYFPKLLSALLPLHVIQVAHHAGLNAHFYRVLLEANYPDQTDRSYLLLSHAIHDRYRPSPEFAQFIGTARSPGNDFFLLFTSEPDAAKVSGYEDLIYPLQGTQASQGDIQLMYESAMWSVTKHSVAV